MDPLPRDALLAEYPPPMHEIAVAVMSPPEQGTRASLQEDADGGAS